MFKLNKYFLIHIGIYFYLIVITRYGITSKTYYKNIIYLTSKLRRKHKFSEKLVTPSELHVYYIRVFLCMNRKYTDFTQ